MRRIGQVRAGMLTVAAALLAGGCSSARPKRSSCDLESDLFLQRQAVYDRWAGRVRGLHDQRWRDDELQLRDQIDAQYRGALSAIINAHLRNDETSYDSCCTERKDPIVNLLCAYLSYLRTSRADPTSYVEGFPTSVGGLRALWWLDHLLLADSKGREPDLPKAVQRLPLGFGTPTESMISELADLVRRGFRPAMSRFVAILEASDGFYGESVGDMWADLLKDVPLVVLSNWSVFREVSDGQFIWAATGWPEDERTGVVAGIERHSAQYPDAARELASRLEEVFGNYRPARRP